MKYDDLCDNYKGISNVSLHMIYKQYLRMTNSNLVFKTC